MKMTIENYGKKMSTKTDNDDHDIFYGLLISMTFSSTTILNGFKEFIEEKEL
jgi:hypothetical protein